MSTKAWMLAGLFLVGCAPAARQCPETATRKAVDPARAIGPVKVVRVTLSPPDARVTLNGEIIEHPVGYVDLPGPVGYAFNLEIDGGGARTARRVEVTPGGAVPSQITLIAAPSPILPPNELDKASSDLLRARTLLGDPGAQPAADPRKATALAVVCVPVCDHVVVSGIDMGKSPFAGRAIPAGEHVIRLSAGPVTKEVVIEVSEGTTRALRVSLDPNAPERNGL